jgi:hypothetical protein
MDMPRRIVRCRNCELYEPNSQILNPNIPAEQQPDPNRGVCRARLPRVTLLVGADGKPQPWSYQPPMNKDGGCAEGEPKPGALH